MKKAVFLLIVLLVLSGCSVYPDSYPFENRNEPIKQIDLLYYPWIHNESEPFMEFRLKRTLEADEIPQFMDSIYALETDRAVPTPLSNYGAYIARVYYENGDIENFASWHIEFVKAGEKALAVGSYYFTGDDFDELFWEYVEKGEKTREETQKSE